MNHPGFFERARPIALQVIADAVGAELVLASDGATEIDDLRPLKEAAATHLTFCTGPKYAGGLGGDERGRLSRSSAAMPVWCPPGRRR